MSALIDCLLTICVGVAYFATGVLIVLVATALRLRRAERAPHARR